MNEPQKSRKENIEKIAKTDTKHSFHNHLPTFTNQNPHM